MLLDSESNRRFKPPIANSEARRVQGSSRVSLDSDATAQQR